MKSIFLKATLCTALFAGFKTVVLAQKTDEIQTVSLFAPHEIKIDGKNFEWKDMDFSINKRTGLSYLISNDNEYLYLIIKAMEVANNTKIMAGGITFSINPDGKKNDKESITLTYPVAEKVGSGDGAVVVSSSTRTGFKDPKRDSAIAAGQKRKLESAKEIKIRGFKNTTDTLISIYNEHGIKVFANIEKDNSFFYELAIPLEALGISIKERMPFAYNLRVNGLQIPGLGNTEVVVAAPGGTSANLDGAMDFKAMTSATDFWGKYTLAKH